MGMVTVLSPPKRHPRNCPCWRYDNFVRLEDGARSGNRTAYEPLPRHVTERVPLEVYEHIISFLRWRTSDLLRCALVCRAWNYQSQVLLYERISICGRKAYNVIAHLSARKEPAIHYLASTRILEVRRHTRESFHYTQFFPMVLCRSMHKLQCLTIAHQSLPPLYRRQVVLYAFSRFSELEHLTLVNTVIRSFPDFCRIIYALPRIQELSLFECGLALFKPQGSDSNMAVLTQEVLVPERGPQLRRLDLQQLSTNLWSRLSRWIEATDISSHSTHLVLSSSGGIKSEPWISSIIHELAPSLTDLYYVTPSYHGTSLSGLSTLARVVNAKLEIDVDLQLENLADLRSDIAAAIRMVITSLSGTPTRTLSIIVNIRHEGYLPTGDDLLDDHLRALEAGPSVDTLPSSLIDSIQLRAVSIGLRPWSGARGILQRGTMEPWVRQLLYQWDTRSILTVNYLTYQDGMRGAIMVF